MKRPFTDQETMRRYLLGALEPQSQRELEERLMTEADLLEEVALAEEELTDDYVAGGLDDEARAKFEQFFLSTPERRRKLKFARAFSRYVDANETAVVPTPARPVREPPRKSWWRSLAPATLLPMRLALVTPLLFVLIAGAATAVIFLQSQQSDYAGAPFVMRAPQTAGGGAQTVSQQPGGKITMAALTPGAVRDAGQTNRIVLPPDADFLQLQLALTTNDYQAYRARLQSAEGQELLALNQLAAEQIESRHVVKVNVPAKLLSPGDFQLKLSGLDANNLPEDIPSYYFRIVRP